MSEADRKCNSKRIHSHIYTCFSSSSSTFLRAHSLERKDKYTRGWALFQGVWVGKEVQKTKTLDEIIKKTFFLSDEIACKILVRVNKKGERKGGTKGRNE